MTLLWQDYKHSEPYYSSVTQKWQKFFFKGTKAWILNEGCILQGQLFYEMQLSTELWQRLHCTFISDTKKYWYKIQVKISIAVT